MLENIAQAEVSKVNHLVEHLENSIRHVKEKLELRRNLKIKKKIAAEQFFELTFSEMRRIEGEFWAKFEKDEQDDGKLVDTLNGKQQEMEAQYMQIKPQFDKMEEKIGLSEFMDIIESKKEIFSLEEEFKKNKTEFFDLVNSA